MIEPLATTSDYVATPRGRRKLAPVFRLLVLGGLLALSGCGGGGGGTKKSAYVARANAICRNARSQTAPLITEVTSLAGPVSLGSQSAAQRLAGVLTRLHTVAAGNLTQLQRLKMPSGDQAAIKRFLTPLGGVVQAIGQAATAVRGGQVPAALGLLEQAGPVAQDATDAAHAYGIRECETVLAVLG